MKRSFIFSAIIALVFLSACSLAEDVTPPPDYQAPTPSSVETVYPIVPPDPERGAEIFAEKCAPCHGDVGRGNGTMASNLSVEVPAIGRSEVALGARPVEWYAVVTNGRMERSMPPFNSLTDRDRWDVVAYALSLHVTQGELDSARVLYEQACQSCHGVQGKGDGAQAAGMTVPDWSQPERLALRSEEELFQTITTGAGEMPAYRDTLTDAQRLGLAAYVRSLTFASPGIRAEAAPTTTPEPTLTPTVKPSLSSMGATPLGSTTATLEVTPDQPQKTTIFGTLKNASGGGFPDGLEATLHAYDDMQAAFTLTAPVKADGSYQFTDVELADNRVFMVTVNVEGVDYNSDPLHSKDISVDQAPELPITIYEVSNDVALLRGDRLHVFFDFTDPKMVQVVELMIFSNPSQQVVAPAAGSTTLLNFKLPAGATDIQFQDGTLGDGTYIQTADGFGVAQAYTPAEGYQVLFAYNLPYTHKGDFELDVPIDVAEAIVMLPQQGVRMKSSQLTDAGSRTVQDIDLELFTGANLSPTSPLKLSLSGRPRQGAQVSSGSTTTLVIGIGAFGLVGAAAGIYFLRRRKARNSHQIEILKDETPETLMDAIIALDDQRRTGELNEEAYLSRRSELKQRLEQALNSKDPGKGAE
ncbi:cytochrome c, mono- and diheme variants [Longilinea arvoryzae]|uniref:Cytochrome c, mono-and diheme variants n=1 Tax=Longilinea arvoryzae TaxID=360412 RepID=A0A0S7BJB2_9CHLR|nr:c-type cytochrome [Longilinea arvoryzae]GAP14011.1 cytochrome c, mono- and diheme variants [Longilinea arvoryzae]